MRRDRSIGPANHVRRGSLCTALLATCTFPAPRLAGGDPAPAPPAVKLREVRVLLAADAPRAKVRSETAIQLFDPSARRLGSWPSGDIALAWYDSPGVVRFGEHSFVAPQLTLRSERNSLLVLSFDRDGQWTAEVPCPGTVRLRASQDGFLEVINEVELEQYVACVVANEVWPTFDREAFRTQAIVTRTFVLYQMMRRPDAPYDVSSTQGSQVYRGVRDDDVGRRAKEATVYTRGLVLTCNDRGEEKLFCTYYSAACGGMSQSAKLLGPEGDVEPLRGGVKCDYCKIAPGDTYRWGPVRLPLDDVFTRLLVRYPELTALDGIASLAPLEQTSTGRLVALRLTGTTGATHDILAERFRLAVGANVIRSTDCRIRVGGGEVTFDNGKGFGHGLGLCQWGVQGLAQSGKQGAEILRFYYPGSKLTRVY